MDTSVPRIKFFLFQVLVVLTFGLLAVQLWRLQMVEGEQYRLRADRNRFRLVPIEAPRGVIYDRRGQLLARNKPSFAVSIVPADLPPDQEDAVLAQLAALLDIPVSGKLQGTLASLPPGGGGGSGLGIKEKLTDGRADPFSPVLVKSNVSREIAFIIEEKHLELPGVRVEIDPIRQYLAGPLLSHIVGYDGPIPRERVEDYQAWGYQPNDKVGLTGVELTFEKELRGSKGRKHIEVDVAGREVRTVGSLIEPQPGHNLVLTIDLDLQQVVEAALRQGMARAGAQSAVAIAMNPNSGELLALVSLPSYDDNLFAGGISAQDYQKLVEDPLRPLFNQAIGGEFPTGSTFKIVTAAAGLQEGVVNRNTLIVDPGTIWLPNKYAPDDPKLAQPFYCWLKTGHGALNVIEGLAQSCDVFFYQVAGGFEKFQGLGIERLSQYARLFGFGAKTGIDLPGETTGLAPDDRWKRLTFGETWVTGDTYNMAIGQGFFLATPLQLLNAAAAVANGGTLYRPQVVFEVRDAEGNLVKPFTPEVIRRLPISAANLALVREGMRAAVTHGTASRTNLAGLAVAGKTGTAEYVGPRDKEGHLPTHAWFIAFAPYEDPQIALVVFLAGGGNGAEMAVPVAAEILRQYFHLPEPR